MATSPTPPSSSLPQPLSYQQILGQALSSYAASTQINDLNVGSAMTSFFSVVALLVSRNSGDIFQVIRDYSLQRATGSALQNLAIEYNVPPLPAKVANGFITVVDLSFQKISTVIYAGVNPPIAGSVTIYVSDASKFPSTGSVYIGRGSVNVEGPLPYSSITAVGSYYAINLSSPTTRYHNISETVILSQGGVRTIPINTIVVSPGVGTSPTLQYQVSQTSLILDGETTVSNVPITALLAGAENGNVPAGAISQFSGNPAGLPNASVTNPLAITTGQDLETDNELRVRVQNALASTGLGTVTAIESALQGVQAPDSSDTIVSTDILNNSSNTIVYIDNGGILEATHLGVPIETIVNSALGGEKFFQLVTGGTQTSVTKAFLQTVAGEPFALFGGEVLAVVVGNTTYDHVFQASDFANPGSATAYEVAASINGDTALNYEAVTAGNGTYVVIRPEDEVTNRIQITTPSSSEVTDANTILQFPSELAETLRLYQNNVLLTEDGSTASIFTQPQSLWSPTLATGETLSLAIDGTAPITFTLTNADFVAEGTYTTLSYSNSLQSWVNVLNNVITGITASIVGSTVEITSNLGAVDRAQIVVVNTVANPTSLISKGFINNTDLSSTGAASQYILDRNTAQIQLASALKPGDSLSAGTLITQANIEAGTVSSGSVTLTSDAHIWISIDSLALAIPTVKSGSLISVSKVTPNIVRYTVNSTSVFSNVLPGDYVIVWSAELPTTDQLEGRVHAVTGSTLDIEVTVAEYTAATPVSNVSFIQGFVVVRTLNVPQKFTIASGTNTLDAIAILLQAQTDELTFSVVDNTNIKIVTNTLDTSGKVTVVTADAQGALIGFSGGVTSNSQSPLIASYETLAKQAELPLFLHSTISADSYADPTYSYVTSFDSTRSLSAFDPNDLISFLNPYGIAPTASGTLTLVYGTGDTTIAFSSYQISSIKNQYIFAVTSANAVVGAVYSNNTQFFTVTATIIAGTTLTTLSAGLIDDEQPANETVQMASLPSANTVDILPVYPDVRRLREYDRFYVASPLDFGANDTVVAIVDNNVLGETYTMPLYRTALVNNTYPSNNYSFNAYDVAAGATASFDTNFSVPPDFFANYKVLLQAKYVVSGYDGGTIVPNSSLLYRSSLFGHSGEAIGISYVYPTSANQPINSVATTNETVGISISLISGAAIATNTAANTQWNVTVTSNTPSAGIDQVTYTYAGLYTFTVTAANATIGAVYSNNGQNFNVTSTIVGGTTLTAQGLSSGSPTASGTLTLVSGTGDATIAFSSYAVSGYGTAPALPVSLSNGAYVTILPSTGFNVKDTGTFRISTAVGFTPTLTSFSVQVPTGTAVAQNNVSTGVPTGMSFYVATPTTASAINTYVNANLTQYVTSTIVNGDGSGVILESTYEGSNFTVQSYSLQDGLNWIASSNVGGSPQFTLKEPLTYSGAPGYSFFTSGEEVRLIPTTMDQVKDFWNILAVTGFTTVGTIETADRGTTLQLATNTIGSVGSIQIVGGSGNEYVVPVLTSGELVGNDEMVISANNIASQAVSSGQWFRLQAANYQNKDTGFAQNTSVTVLSNTPVAGQSTITLSNQESNQLYFGSPRNFVMIAGRTFRIEKQGSLACLSWNGVGASPMFGAPLSFNDAGGWTVNITVPGTYTVASGTTNFSALSIGDLITITGAVNAGNNGTFFVESVTADGSSFDISNPNAVMETGTAIAAGAFTSTASVSEGDTVIIDGGFTPLNQGSYRVIRSNNDSIWYENANTVEEEVTCIPHPISTGYDATSVFNVTASGGTETLSWSGAGTQPFLNLALPGDMVTFGSGFSSPNQGNFTVVNSGPSQQQIVQFSMPSGATFTSSGPGEYFEMWNGGNANKYYVWFNVSGGSNTDPAPAGFTGIEVTVNSSDNNVTVANETYNAIITASPVALTASVTSNVVTVTATLAAATNEPVDVSMPGAFSFVVTQTGQTAFLSVVNPAATPQSGISSVIFVVNRPQIKFYQYEATVPGDKISINGAVLGVGNAGNYKILEVVSPNTVIVSGIISTQYNTNLGGNYVSFSVQEGVAYTGYKQVDYVAFQPGSSNYNNIILNTSAQYEKIDISANVGMTALNKLNFPTPVKDGIDGYSYDTGLIGQANRVVYGDPRDSVTYPGVNAAGTNIFIREPLLKSISISMSIRTNIGVSFPQIVTQIQSSVYALVQANKLGQSLDLSSIVEVARSIPGVTSVVITNPTYTVSSDEIVLSVGEKGFIPSQINNINVSLIGS
jgi:hypothetical protein